MWKNIVEWGRPQMTIWRMRIACWIHKVTDTYSECVIFIALHCNNAPLLRHYVQCLYYYTLL